MEQFLQLVTDNRIFFLGLLLSGVLITMAGIVMDSLELQRLTPEQLRVLDERLIVTRRVMLRLQRRGRPIIFVGSGLALIATLALFCATGHETGWRI